MPFWAGDTDLRQVVSSQFRGAFSLSRAVYRAPPIGGSRLSGATTDRYPKWCAATCRHRAWEQARAAASGRAAVQVVERRVEVRISAAPTRREWPRLLNELARQLDDGRVYDRDLPRTGEGDGAGAEDLPAPRVSTAPRSCTEEGPPAVLQWRRHRMKPEHQPFQASQPGCTETNCRRTGAFPLSGQRAGDGLLETRVHRNSALSSALSRCRRLTGEGNAASSS
jgi:hypothetical protein